MSKCLFLSCLLVFYQLPAGECQYYAGDSCHTPTGPGTCRLLPQCEPLMAEIRRAGSPMPHRLGQKLRSLTCGYESDEPVVCCESSLTNAVNQDAPAHGTGGGGNQWQTTDSNGNGKPADKTQSSTGPRGPAAPGVGANGSTGSPPSVRGHKNLDLLPKNCGAVVEGDRILGGKRTRLYELPWMVLLAYDSDRGTSLSCGGTLIHERYVLTAAHCVAYLGSRLTLSAVVLGEHDVSQDPDCERVEGKLKCAPSIRYANIEKAIPHPGYNSNNYFDDIALVRLAEAANFTLESVKPICLPDTPELQAEKLEGQYGTVAGWGATESGVQSPVLLSVDLLVASNRECQAAYKGSKIYERQLCAGGSEGKDSCAGDSGGPLFVSGRIRSGATRYVQRGVVSYGLKTCGTGSHPGVYTRVGNYMEWILDNMSN